MGIKDSSIEQFLDELASKSSTPGGGSAAAIIGAIGAALLSMVAGLTLGNKKYEQVCQQMEEILQRSEELRRELESMIQADVDAFTEVMAAYAMPKETGPEKAERSDAIQTALKTAADVPLDCAGICLQLIGLSEQVAGSGNRNVISDAGVAVLAAHAALRSAALNVYINLAAIRDTEFVRDRRDRLDALLAGSHEATERVYQMVMQRL